MSLHPSSKPKVLLCNFDMKDLGEAFHILVIKFIRDGSCGNLGLSQRAYIDKVLTRFNCTLVLLLELQLSKETNF